MGEFIKGKCVFGEIIKWGDEDGKCKKHGSWVIIK